MIFRSLPVCLLVVVCLTLPAGQKASAGQGYRAYVAKILTQLPPGSRVRPDIEAYLNQLASSARKRAGRKPLKASQKLTGAARGQAADMLLGNYVGHHSRSGYRFSARFAAYAGKDFQGRHGENAARDRHRGAVNKAKAKRLFNQWMNSGGHRRNLLNRSYAYVSTGAIQKGNHLYAVQIFWEPGQKKPSVNMLVIN